MRRNKWGASARIYKEKENEGNERFVILKFLTCLPAGRDGPCGELSTALGTLWEVTASYKEGRSWRKPSGYVIMGGMLSDYISKKLKQARFKLLPNGSYFGEIPELKGVWASASTREGCRKELEEVLEDWLFLKIRDRESVPGFGFKIDRRNLAEYA